MTASISISFISAPRTSARSRWGAAVTTAIGRNGDINHCAGIHLNMPLAFPLAGMSTPTPEEQAALDSMEHYQKWDSGYSKQQSTRPQTLGYGLVDSPAGRTNSSPRSSSRSCSSKMSASSSQPSVSPAQ